MVGVNSRIPVLLLLSMIYLVSCSNKQTKPQMISTPNYSTSKTDFKFFTLTNSNGVKCQLSNYGARVISLNAPDKNGVLEDIIVGYNTVEDFFTKHDAYYGATVGRYANRINEGSFKIDNKVYQLEINNGDNALHGGVNGFDKKYWEVILLSESSITFRYISSDMEEGYPGELSVEVTYTLSSSNELVIDYKAVTTAKTIVNLTNHSYFNLSGSTLNDVLNHEVLINADFITEVDSSSIPTGKFYEVDNTPFDFRTFKTIGKEINSDNEQLNYGNGYDHNFVLNDNNLAARVIEPISGRTLEVYTDQPGMQFYVGNFLKGEIGKNNEPINKRTAFCLETQHFPDSPNRPEFPSTVLEKGEVFTSQTIYKVGVVE